jgi:hypothetical protein
MSDELTFLQPVSAVKPSAFEWLWPGRLALGYLFLLEGDPGLGKSLIALDLCARLSKGLPCPDGSPGLGPAKAIFLNREDGLENVTCKRLAAAGADPDRVFVPKRQDQDFSLPSRLAPLEADLERMPEVRLVVLDPATAFFDGSVVLASDLSIRRALDPLQTLARRFRCAVLLLRHLNKLLGTHAAYRGLGSIGFVGACRSGWLVGADPEDAERGVFAQVKNNIAPRQPSLAYTIQTGPGGEPVVCWGGISPLNARQLLAGTRPKPSADTNPRERCCAFLEGFLQEGPRSIREVWAEAQKRGLASRTLNRAKDDLGIRSQVVWAGGVKHSYWLLPHQELPALPGTVSDTPELDAQLAALKAKYPPSCPLDEEQPG